MTITPPHPMLGNFHTLKGSRMTLAEISKFMQVVETCTPYGSYTLRIMGRKSDKGEKGDKEAVMYDFDCTFHYYDDACATYERMKT